MATAAGSLDIFQNVYKILEKVLKNTQVFTISDLPYVGSLSHPYYNQL